MNEPTPRAENTIVARDPNVHSGDLVFAHTRVPVQTLVDYLKKGRSIEDFQNGFPSVEHWQVEAFLDRSPEAVEATGERGATSP